MARHRSATFCIAIASALLAGCATQLRNPEVGKEELDEERAEQLSMAVSMHLERMVRLDRVAKRVAVAGADLCGEDVDHAYGITWTSAADLSDPYRAVAPRVGLTGGVQIWDTTPRLPASRAKIRKGTRVVAVNGTPVDDYEDLARAIRPSWESGRLRLELDNGAGRPLRDITIRGVKACRYAVVLVEDDAVNAYADGDSVYIPVGMMRFADSDSELALVIGHEMAHNRLGHVKEKKVTGGIGRGLGMVLDLAVGLVGIPTGGGFSALGGAASDAATSGRSRNFESDADYMGLYMVRRAGYDVSKAHLFWRQMAAEYPSSIKGSMMASHPSSPERAAALEAAQVEIHRKEKARRPLVPEGDLVVPANQE